MKLLLIIIFPVLFISELVLFVWQRTKLFVGICFYGLDAYGDYLSERKSDIDDTLWYYEQLRKRIDK